MKKSKSRRSRHSRCQCGASLPLSPADELAQVKLEIEKAKLAKLQEDLPDPNAPEYTRWEDLPPPSPEDEARYYAEFQRIFDYVVEEDQSDIGHIFHDGKILRGPKAILNPNTGLWLVGTEELALPPPPN